MSQPIAHHAIAHKDTHHSGGADPLSLGNIAGQLVAAQHPSGLGTDLHHPKAHSRGDHDYSLIPQVATDPTSPANGDIWHNTTDGYLKIRIAGVTYRINLWDDIMNKPASFPPSAHASTHHSGGGDALALGSIAGTLVSAQHPSGLGADLHHAQLHKDAHKSGGGDAFVLADTLDCLARLRIMKGQIIGQRRALNFIEGSLITLTMVDDPTNEKVDVTIAVNAHAARHADGGADEITSKLDLGAFGGVDPAAHASRHVDGGADEILSALDLAAIPLLPDTKLNFGTWKKISEVVPGSTVDYVDFNGLDINTDKFYVLFITIKNPAVTGRSYYIFVNGDTTITNYYTQGITGSGTTVSATRVNLPGVGGAGAGERIMSIIFITRDPDGYFRFSVLEVRATGSAVMLAIASGTKTATVTNITSIRIGADAAGGIAAGSKLMLCKPRTA